LNSRQDLNVLSLADPPINHSIDSIAARIDRQSHE